LLQLFQDAKVYIIIWILGAKKGVFFKTQML